MLPVFTIYPFFLTHPSCFFCFMINILRQMKKIMIELMNRLQSIDSEADLGLLQDPRWSAL